MRRESTATRPTTRRTNPALRMLHALAWGSEASASNSQSTPNRSGRGSGGHLKRALGVTIRLLTHRPPFSQGQPRPAGSAAAQTDCVYQSLERRGMSDHFAEAEAPCRDTRAWAMALSGDGSTMAVGAPHESSGARASTETRTTIQPTRPAPSMSTPARRPVDAPGVRQGVEYGPGDYFGSLGGLERGRQHDGGRCPLGVERGNRNERRSGRRFAAAGRRGLRLQSQREAPGRSRRISKPRTPEGPEKARSR